MNSLPGIGRAARALGTSVLAAMLCAHAAYAIGQEVRVVLSGNQEIPPAATSASGRATLVVDAERNASGSVTIAGMTPTVAHIHEAPAGANGSIVVPLIQTADNVWSLPPGTRFTEAQYKSFKAGNLYFNIHSEAFRSGEIRGQIRP